MPPPYLLCATSVKHSKPVAAKDVINESEFPAFSVFICTVFQERRSRRAPTMALRTHAASALIRWPIPAVAVYHRFLGKVNYLSVFVFLCFLEKCVSAFQISILSVFSGFSKKRWVSLSRCDVTSTYSPLRADAMHNSTQDIPIRNGSSIF